MNWRTTVVDVVNHLFSRKLYDKGQVTYTQVVLFFMPRGRKG